MSVFLTTEQVIAIHDLESVQPLRDRGLLDSAVGRPRAGWGGTLLFPTALEQAAVLLAGVSQAQAFVDGNKRTAWIAGAVVLSLNGIDLGLIGDAEILALMQGISTHAIDGAEVAEWLRDRSNPQGAGQDASGAEGTGESGG